MRAPFPVDLIDPDAVKVLRRLTNHRFDAYLVGGCVRDLLLDRRPKDFDIATSARPRQVRRLFRNSRIIGRRFRLAHIHFGDHVLEVATFRAPPIGPEGVDEGEADLYVRRDNVYGTEKQDAFRRDFTINGLFYDLAHRRVIDHVDGLADLDAGVLRTIGDPDVRLREDPIRILRAAKFAGRLDFALAEDLAEAMTRHAKDLEKSAPPRVLEELYRLLSGEGSARSFGLLDELGAIHVLLPELQPLEPGFYGSLQRLENITGGSRGGAPQSLMIAALLWPAVSRVLRERPPGDPELFVHEALEPFARRFTLTRRDLARSRESLAGQVRLAEAPEGGMAHRFARREIFSETLALRSIVGPLDPDADDHSAAWKALASEVPPAGTRQRRRRRRRRRRRHPGESGDA